jgi:putative NADH-flavin reductase
MYLMRIGVVGATGNLGLRVVAEAVGRGHQVRALPGISLPTVVGRT